MAYLADYYILGLRRDFCYPDQRFYQNQSGSEQNTKGSGSVPMPGRGCGLAGGDEELRGAGQPAAPVQGRALPLPKPYS